MKGQVVVRLREQVLDPQGVTIGKALKTLGFEGVRELRQGKVFDVELDTSDPAAAERLLEAMAKELLANPVTESFEVHLLKGEGEPA